MDKRRSSSVYPEDQSQNPPKRRRVTPMATTNTSTTTSAMSDGARRRSRWDQMTPSTPKASIPPPGLAIVAPRPPPMMVPPPPFVVPPFGPYPFPPPQLPPDYASRPPPPFMPASYAPASSSVPSFWHGQLDTPSFRFPTSFKLVSGPAHLLQRDLPASINFPGHISSKDGYEYLTQVRKTGGKDLIVVFRLTEPPSNDDRQQWDGLLANMVQKRRFCAIDNKNLPMIKNFYILPLPANEEPNEALGPFHDGPGLEMPGKRTILGLVVRHRERQNENVAANAVNDGGSLPPELAQHAGGSMPPMGMGGGGVGGPQQHGGFGMGQPAGGMIGGLGGAMIQQQQRPAPGENQQPQGIRPMIPGVQPQNPNPGGPPMFNSPISNPQPFAIDNQQQARNWNGNNNNSRPPQNQNGGGGGDGFRGQGGGGLRGNDNRFQGPSGGNGGGNQAPSVGRLCQFFLRGNCHFGDKCRLRHEEPSSQSNNRDEHRYRERGDRGGDHRDGGNRSRFRDRSPPRFNHNDSRPPQNRNGGGGDGGDRVRPCRKCDSTMHEIRFCPDITCFKCLGKGHTKDVCPSV